MFVFNKQIFILVKFSNFNKVFIILQDFKSFGNLVLGIEIYHILRGSVITCLRKSVSNHNNGRRDN